MQRIIILGSAGAGKTSLAHKLSMKLQITHVELDSLIWGPQWSMQPENEVWSSLQETMKQSSWIIDGNAGFKIILEGKHKSLRSIILPQADTIIWLDYCLPRILWQLLKRFFYKWTKREELFSGNRESFVRQFLSKNSIFLWAISTFKRRREKFQTLILNPQYSYIKFIRLSSSAATEKWLLRI